MTRKISGRMIGIGGVKKIDGNIRDIKRGIGKVVG